MPPTAVRPAPTTPPPPSNGLPTPTPESAGLPTPLFGTPSPISVNHPPSLPANHPPPSLRLEYVRGALSRPAQIAAGSGGLLLLVAIQHFDAGRAPKAMLSAASFVGLLFSPLVVSLVARRRWTPGRGLAALYVPAGLGLAAAAISPGFGGFVAGVLVGAPLVFASTPLITTVWRQNVGPARRGRLFGQATTLAGVAGIAAALATAAWMGADAGRYRPVVALLGLMLLAAGAAAWRIPGTAMSEPTGSHPLGVLKLLWRHRVFGVVNLAWMLLGLGNLMTVPLRTEHTASAQHGLGYTPDQVLLLTLVLPQVGLLASTLIWGRLYDRVSFLALRVALNGFFIASIAAFFGTSWHWQIASALFYGIAEGGGAVVWSLWVTRYAPAERTADFMAVHTFLTGVRGLAAPVITYSLLGTLTVSAVAAIGLGLLVLSCLVLVAVIPFDRAAEVAA